MITPAKRNGVGVQVILQYSVDFVKKDKKTTITVLPYQGYAAQKEKVLYVAPQRIISKKWTVLAGCPSKMFVGLKSSISAKGEPSNAEVISGAPNDVCTAGIKRWNSRQRFIPAMENGKPVSSTHIEYVYGRVDIRGGLRE